MHQADIGDINATSYELHVSPSVSNHRQPGFFIFISGGIPFISVTAQFCEVRAEYFAQRRLQRQRRRLSHYPWMLRHNKIYSLTVKDVCIFRDRAHKYELQHISYQFATLSCILGASICQLQRRSFYVCVNEILKLFDLKFALQK